MLNIIVEPQGKTYTALLRLAIQYCSSFSLTWRDQLKFNETASLMMSALLPFLIRELHTNEWPGTQLIDQKAMVRYYQFTEDTLRILSEVSSLYAWLSPNLPEDLAFYREDERCWLFSIAHEKDAAILDESLTVDFLSRAVPGLQVRHEELSAP
jgi:hypothetical protein